MSATIYSIQANIPLPFIFAPIVKWENLRLVNFFFFYSLNKYMSWQIEDWTKQFAGVIGKKNSTIYNNHVFAGVIGQKKFHHI